MNRNTKSTDTDAIPFALPAIGREEEAAVLEVLRSGWLTTGAVARQFELEFAEKLSISHALAVNSATSGLHLALEAVGIGQDDWVVTSPYTFTATVEIARYLGAHPLFVDIEEDTLNIDPDLLEEVLAKETRRIRGIIPVHIGGYPCDMARISDMASSRRIKVVEDAAHAFPCVTNRGPAGTTGDMAVFSFYATKTITSGEGGMVVTDSEELAQKVKILRLHGIDREVWNRYHATGNATRNAMGGEVSPPTWEYDVVAPGYKYNMPDLNAAVGLEQLRKADRFQARRTEIAGQYLDAFRELDFIRTPPDSRGHSWHLFVIGIEEQLLTISRDEYLVELFRAGIGTSVHYKPLHLMRYYRSEYGLRPEDFPRSVSRFRTALSLPIYPSLDDEQVRRIIQAVASVGKEHYRGHG